MTHHLDALGWTLIHFCWQAAVIALVYRVADAAWSKARSQVRYVLALGALLSMLAASLGTLAYEEVHGASELSWPAIAGSRAGHEISIELAAVTGNGAMMAASNHAVQARHEQAAQAARNSEEFQPAGVMLWLDVLWLVGVLSLSLRTVGGWWMIQRLRRTGLTAAPAAVEQALRTLCRRLGLKRRIDVYLCEQIGSPIVIGVFRSLVLLPVSALAALDPEQLEVVLAHELAHVRRADYFWNILQTVVETIFFFHPAVWWLGRNLRQQREQCCDDAALECCADPLVYASALLRLEEQRRTRLHLAMALDGNQSPFSLKARIARILGDAPMRRSPRDLAPASLLGISTALALFLLPLPQLFASLSHAGKATPVQQVSAVVLGPSPAFRRSSPPAISLAPAAKTGKTAPTEKCDEEAATSVWMQPAMRTAQHNLELARTVGPHAVVEIAENAGAPMLFLAEHAGQSQSDGAQSGQAQSDQSTAKSGSGSKRDYIDAMRAAGYDVDLDKYVAMKVQDITPEYAQKMATIGFGKPTADELIAMKVQGVDPGQVKEMKDAGMPPAGFNDLIQYRIFNVTPEFIAAVKASGMQSISSKKIVEMRVQGITPEFIKSVRQQFPEATADEMVQMKIFNIDADFIASAKRHGFTPLTIQKLVKLRISGVLD